MTLRPDHPSTRPDRGAALAERLATVLGDLTFPARRWQVLTVGDLYGVDTATRGLLELLPERRYQSLPEIVAVVTAVLVGRPVTAIPGAPPRAPRLARHRPAPRGMTGRRPVPRTPVA
jgi:hypothetical protein